jgi:RecB family exonuclease
MSNDYSIPEKYQGRKIWSYSKLTSFEECAYSYYLQRIKKVKSKQNIWGLLGGLVHTQCELLIRQETTKENAIKELLSKLDDAELAGIIFPTKQMEENYKQSLIHYFERFELPDVKSFKIEQKEFLELDDNNVLIGFIDFIIQHHDDSIEIIDFKTSSKFSKEDLKKKARQLVIYSEMLKQRYKKITNVKVSYDMLKYAVVRYKDQKRTKTVERHKLVALIQDKIKADLELIYDELQVNEILIEAISKNEIPKEVVANYTITPYNQVYEYGEEEIKDLYTWLGETIQNINNSIDYPAKIDETEQIEFFCTNLCSVSESCEPFQRYKEEKGGEKPLDDGLF